MATEKRVPLSVIRDILMSEVRNTQECQSAIAALEQAATDTDYIPHAYWKYDAIKYKWPDGSISVSKSGIVCSHCKQESKARGYYANFCNECGAKMDAPCEYCGAVFDSAKNYRREDSFLCPVCLRGYPSVEALNSATKQRQSK